MGGKLVSEAEVSEVLSSLLTMVADTAAQRGKAVPPKDSFIVLVGGTSLCVQHIREQSLDIDFYGSRQFVEAALEVEDNIKHQFNDEFRIDATSSDFIWGQLRIGDIEDSPLWREFEVGAVKRHKFAVKMLPLDTLFVVKADSGREKDIADLALISAQVTKEQVLTRLNKLYQYNDPKAFGFVMENILSECQMQYGLPIDAEDLRLLSALPERMLRPVCESFGIELSEVRAKSAQKVTP